MHRPIGRYVCWIQAVTLALLLLGGSFGCTPTRDQDTCAICSCSGGLVGIQVYEPNGAYSACDCYQGGEDASTCESVDLRFRADGIEGASEVDVTIWVNGSSEHLTGIAPGTYLDKGQVPAASRVAIEVKNRSSVGAVRAHILVDDCFRGSRGCHGAGCTALACKVAVKEPCTNY